MTYPRHSPIIIRKSPTKIRVLSLECLFESDAVANVLSAFSSALETSKNSLLTLDDEFECLRIRYCSAT